MRMSRPYDSGGDARERFFTPLQVSPTQSLFIRATRPSCRPSCTYVQDPRAEYVRVASAAWNSSSSERITVIMCQKESM